jgi:hypothetical protein
MQEGEVYLNKVTQQWSVLIFAIRATSRSVSRDKVTFVSKIKYFSCGNITASPLPKGAGIVLRK